MGDPNDPLILEQLTAAKDPEELIARAKLFELKLRKTFDGKFRVDTPERFFALLKFMDDQALQDRLLKPKTIETYRFLSEEYGISIDIFDRIERNSLLNIAEDDALLKFIREETGKLLTGNNIHSGSNSLQIRSIDDVSNLAAIVAREDAVAVLSVIVACQNEIIPDYFALPRSPNIGASLPSIEYIRKNFPQIKIQLYKVHLLLDQEIAHLLTSESAKIVYEQLTALLPHTYISLDEFLSILKNPHAKTLLTDREFIGAFREIARLCGSTYKINLLSFLLQIGTEKRNRILSTEGREMIAWLKTAGVSLNNGSDLENFSALLEQDSFTSLKLLDDAGLLKKLFDLTYLLIGYSSLYALRFNTTGEALTDPKVREDLKTLAASNIFSKVNIRELPSLISLVRIPGAMESLTNIRTALGAPINNPTSQDLQGIQLSLHNKTFVETILNPKFVEFCVQIRQRFFAGNQISLKSLEMLVEIFPDASILLGKGCARIIDMLHKDFHFSTITDDMIPPLIGLAKSLDLDAIDSLRTELGQHLVAHDIFLLDIVARTPDLRALLLDRQRLLADAEEIYASSSLQRANLDVVIPDYTERPPLLDLDSLALMRLVILKRALADQTVLTEIGRVVARDISDTSTEYGGQILWRDTGAYFNSVRSTSIDNGSYGNTINKFLNGGLMSFHLHALSSNESAFAGPSGDPLNPQHGGDWGFVRTSRITDVVITTTGYSDIEQTSLQINVDMYYIDTEGRYHVIDLGLYRVPVPTK
jgi:hypothetical protein